jgi:hypothetical protein
MTTKEKINNYPFNSDYEEKVLLDELISTSHNGERLYISENLKFAYVHEKTLFANMCKAESIANYIDNEQRFKQKLTRLNAKGGQAIVC